VEPGNHPNCLVAFGDYPSLLDQGTLAQRLVGSATKRYLCLVAIFVVQHLLRCNDLILAKREC
jgi:hypothetical protein